MKKAAFNYDIKKENIKELETMRKNFKYLRLLHNWSIEELSNISAIDQKILIDIENGEDFDIQYFFMLCHIYHMKPHEIFYHIA